MINEDDTLLEDALYYAILEHFFDEEKQLSSVPQRRTIVAFCQVLASFAALDPSRSTESLASEIRQEFSKHRERFLEYYDENPLNRPDRFGHRPQ